MATDRAIWKALDLGLYASNIEFTDVRQTMIDVHTRTHKADLWDVGDPLTQSECLILSCKRKCRIVSAVFTSWANITANDVNYALFAVYTTTSTGAFKAGICGFTTQTLAFTGPAPWGVGDIVGGVPLDLIQFGVAHPTKLIFDVANVIEPGDQLVSQLFKLGAGVITSPTNVTPPAVAFAPSSFSLEIEEI